MWTNINSYFSLNNWHSDRATICLCLFRKENVLWYKWKMVKIFWLFVPLMHLCTTTFHSVHNFHPPAEISAATHSQIGLKENGCQASPVPCPSHSTDKLPCYHMKRMPSYAYLYQLPRTDHHGCFLVNTNVSKSICLNLSHEWYSSPD